MAIACLIFGVTIVPFCSCLGHGVVTFNTYSEALVAVSEAAKECPGMNTRIIQPERPIRKPVDLTLTRFKAYITANRPDLVAQGLLDDQEFFEVSFHVQFVNS